MRSKHLIVAGITASVFAAAASAASVQAFKLRDHPDGNANPPPYGLRMDGLFNGYAGATTNQTTTFSFNSFSDVYLVVNDTGSDIDITISGTVYGGEDSGTGYGFGEGAYHLLYNITLNVATMGTGWLVSSPSNGLNQGTLTAHAGITGISAGTVFDIFESNSMGNPFKFLQDNHRLLLTEGGAANYPEAGQGFWVGRGWNTTNSDGSPTSGTTQDWLFLGSIIPLPSAAGLGLAGLFALPALRRRR